MLKVGDSPAAGRRNHVRDLTANEFYQQFQANDLI
jgi:hypothetical protein